MNESERKLAELLQKQISARDIAIEELQKRNDVQSIIINQNKKYKKLMIFLCILLTMSAISNIICFIH
jgi:hypothetical protein